MCNAGFHHGDAEPAYPCSVCARDHYQDDIGTDACKQCPPHTHTVATTSTALTDCLCDAGFSGPLGGPCTACEPGSFKAGPGAGSCVACPADSFQPETNASACVSCHEHSSSAEGTVLLATCKCNNGFSAIAGPACVACEPGTFAHVESQVCTNCSDGTFSEDFGAIACSVCGAHALSHEQPHVACQCDAGFVLANASCVACGVDYYKDRFGDEGCMRCQAHSQAPSASLRQEACQCNAGYEQDGPAVCQICEPGTFSDTLDTVACPACAHPSFSGASGQTVCTFCLPDSSVDYASTGCQCDPGFTSTGRDGDGAEHCEQCSANLYKETQANSPCLPCQNNSQSEQRATSFEQCLCDRGYARVGRGCVACATGTFKDHTNNSYGCAACADGFTFAGVLAAEECEPCNSLCPDVPGEPRRYVSRACNVTHDVGCSPCRICAAGTHALPECSDGANRDRNDTACAACLEDHFCEGGLAITACPVRSHTGPGAASVGACVCEPGMYTTAGPVCAPCPEDFFCADNAQHRCPAHALTAGGSMSVLLDCVCDGGYFKNMSTATSFSCALCTVNDYCFDNSLFNCSSPRMVSLAGSDEASDCRCVSGYYNNGTECDPCKADSFCEDGTLTACAPDRWTADLALRDGPDKCLCRPGLYLHAASGECVACPLNRFCEGDNVAYQCTRNSSTAGELGRQRCDCDQGFANLDTGNVLSCVPCASESYKNYSGNAACSTCQLCVSLLTYESSACVPVANRVCEACFSCEQPFFQAASCNVQDDTQCDNCTQCDVATQIETRACNEGSRDALCEAIRFDHVCLTGSVAGNHTLRLQPTCLACEVRPSNDPADRWFDFTTPGSVYADVRSCSVRCRGYSRLRNESQPWMGCQSCETGNVLFRAMGPGCNFTCRDGFALNEAGSDCELPVLRQGPSNTLPSMSITNWVYGAEGHNITVAHSNSNRFVILVGGHAPHGCGPGVCCYPDLVRVSTKQQMGLAAQTPEACSQNFPLTSGKLSQTTLWTHVPHTMLPRLATCTEEQTGLQCDLVFTLLDVLFWRTIPQTLRIHVNMTSSLVVLNAETRYLPLETLAVEIILVSRSAASDTWQVALGMHAVAGAHWLVDIAVRGMDQHPVSAVCGRYDGSTQVLAQPYFNVSATRAVWLSQWSSAPGTGTVLMTLTLRRAGLLMSVAVVRNVTHAVVQCVDRVQVAQLATGAVIGIAGLGSGAVHRAQRLAADTVWKTTGHGNADRLFTFVAHGVAGAPVAATLRRLLAVHTTANVTGLPALVTRFSGGKLVFDYAFREWCRAQHGCEYEYIARYARLAGRGNMLRVDCAQPQASAEWLTHAIGAHRDAGHIAAVCMLADTLPHAVAYLVATGQVLNRREWSQEAYNTLLWPQFAFETLVS